MSTIPATIIEGIDSLVGVATQREWIRKANDFCALLQYEGATLSTEDSNAVLSLIATRLDADESYASFFDTYGDPTKRGNTKYRAWLHDGWDSVTERHKDVVEMYRGFVILVRAVEILGVSPRGVTL